MDPFTHALVGASLAVVISDAPHRRKAALAGALIALLPDADIWLGRAGDPLQEIAWHRHFSHALIMAPLAGWLFAWLGKYIGWKMPIWRSFFLAGFVYASACLLDWCTSYGTWLFWPFINAPSSLGIIAVVDPFFSLLLLTGLAWFLVRNSVRAPALSLLLAVCYLFAGALQQQRAQVVATGLAMERQVDIIEQTVKPTMGNLILWRLVSVDRQGWVRADAVHLGLKTRIYPGEAAPGFDPARLPSGHPLRPLLARYERLNQPLLMKHPEPPLMIGDARFAMLPGSLAPLWGLEITGDEIRFVTRRYQDAQMRQDFLDMLLGRERRHFSGDR